MADTKIADLGALASVATGDLVPVVDVSDTTDSAQGTTKRITVANLTALKADASHTHTASAVTDFSTAADARISAAVGVSVQAYDADLTAFAAKTAPSGAVVGTTDAQTLTNKTLTAPAISSPTGIAKGDVGLGNVDNTSDATKNAATATLTNKRVTPRAVALTDGANIATNSDNGDSFAVTLGGNRTMDNPTGTPTDGQKILYRITQDGTGSRTLTWGSAFAWGSDVAAPTLSTGAGKVDYAGFIWSAASSKWHGVAVAKGY